MPPPYGQVLLASVSDNCTVRLWTQLVAVIRLAGRALVLPR